MSMKCGIVLGIILCFLNFNSSFGQIMPPDEVLKDMQTQKIFTNVFILLIGLVLVFGIRKILK